MTRMQTSIDPLQQAGSSETLAAIGLATVEPTTFGRQSEAFLAGWAEQL